MCSVLRQGTDATRSDATDAFNVFGDTDSVSTEERVRGLPPLRFQALALLLLKKEFGTALEDVRDTSNPPFQFDLKRFEGC